MKQLKFLFFFCCFIFTTQTFADDKLIFAIDVIRHGDRTPIQLIPKAPYLWPEGLGELTALGMKQEFDLGQEHRQLYINQTNLLPAHYKADSIYVCSTDVNRTLMSAESFLLGLYPLGTGPDTLPQSFQPIPIHLKMQANQTNLIPDVHFSQSIAEKYIYSRPDWQTKTHELTPKFAEWSQLTGITVSNLSQLVGIADTLFIDQLHHAPLPPGLSEQEANAIIDAGKWAFVTAYKPYEASAPNSAPLLTAINDYLQQGSQQTTPLKWVLFSAHDSTLLSLMSTLQNPLDAQPHYASDLNIALYMRKPGDYFVKLTYNNKPVYLPTCAQTDCTLQQFSQFVKSHSG